VFAGDICTLTERLVQILSLYCSKLINLIFEDHRLGGFVQKWGWLFCMGKKEGNPKLWHLALGVWSSADSV
jgi:hypothetical protein